MSATATRQAETQAREETILQALKSAAPLDIPAIAGATELSESEVRKGVANMQRKNLIVRTESGGYDVAPANTEGGVAKPAGKAKAAKAPATATASSDAASANGGEIARRRADAAEMDEKVHGLLTSKPEGLTKNEINESLGTHKGYHSIWRLRKTGRVEKVSSGTREPKWIAK